MNDVHPSSFCLIEMKQTAWWEHLSEWDNLDKSDGKNKQSGWWTSRIVAWMSGMNAQPWWWHRKALVPLSQHTWTCTSDGCTLKWLIFEERIVNECVCVCWGSELYFLFFPPLSLCLCLCLPRSPSLSLLSRAVSYCTRISIVRQALFFLCALSLSLSAYCPAIFPSHRLIHHQSAGALHRIGYVANLVLVMMRDVVVWIETREEEIESVVH